MRSIISHLIQVRIVGIGDGPDKSHLVGLGADRGLVLHDVTDLHILQLSKIGMAATIVAEQTNVAGIDARRGIVTSSFGH